MAGNRNDRRAEARAGGREDGMSRERMLSETFVELADTLVDDFDVLDFLHNLTTRSVGLLGSDAAAIVLGDHRGELQIVSSTTHAATELEVIAIASRAGPCLDAVATGRPVVNIALEDASARWPDFTAAAEAAGIHTINVFPMRLRSEVLGAMSLMWRTSRTLSEDDIAIASALTSVATMSLLHQRTTRQREVVAEQLHSTLNDLVVVEQAKGVVAEVLQVEVGEAFSLMLAHARGAGTSLTALARELLEEPPRAGRLLPHP